MPDPCATDLHCMFTQRSACVNLTIQHVCVPLKPVCTAKLGHKHQAGRAGQAGTGCSRTAITAQSKRKSALVQLCIHQHTCLHPGRFTCCLAGGASANKHALPVVLCMTLRAPPAMQGTGRPGVPMYRSLRSFLRDAHHNRLLAVPASLYAVNNYLKFAMQLYFKPVSPPPPLHCSHLCGRKC